MAILKIRDANGNVQEILSIKGEDGKDGKDGVDGQPGKDYVLTEADKQEIANIIMSSMVLAVDTDAIDDHIADKNNPHGVTAKQVGARPDDWCPTAGDIGGLHSAVAEIVAEGLANASIAYVGSAAPASDLGKDGDIYIVSG